MLRDDHPLRVRLREAAIEWVDTSRVPSPDVHDRAFKRIDRKLYRAAIAVAKAELATEGR